ncbi:MAG: hypothetical protein JXR76_30770 [Deltaproteobacteria bacterium]|nr:hypothetical protein [Deltaproteobacteria bacterium]
MAQLTEHALKSMGYMKISSTDPLNVVIHYFCVMQVQGFNIEEATPQDTRSLLHRTKIGDLNIVAACGDNLNEITQQLIGHAYTPADEYDEWKKTNSCGPPFIIIHVSSNKYQEFTDGWIKEIDDNLSTYDCFNEIRRQVPAQISPIVSRTIAGLNCAFFSEQTPVRFRRIENKLFALTANNKIVMDFRLEFHANAYVVKPVSKQFVNQSMQLALEKAGEFHASVSKLISMALEEDDKLKKFLFLYTSIEIAIHKTFRMYRSDDLKRREFGFTDDVKEKLLEITQMPLSEIKNPTRRFLWCFIFVWKHLKDLDIDTFEELKQIRNSVSHGDIEVFQFKHAFEAERLSLKLHSG